MKTSQINHTSIKINKYGKKKMSVRSSVVEVGSFACFVYANKIRP